jgi:hypothetical protein
MNYTIKEIYFLLFSWQLIKISFSNCQFSLLFNSYNFTIDQFIKHVQQYEYVN